LPASSPAPEISREPVSADLAALNTRFHQATRIFREGTEHLLTTRRSYLFA
jgi:hypothetical protein